LALLKETNCTINAAKSDAKLYATWILNNWLLVELSTLCSCIDDAETSKTEQAIQSLSQIKL
jgi:hypothetical protein